MRWNVDRVLLLSAHTDDMELGAGATARMLVESGAKVTSIVFSDCKQSVDTSSFPVDILRKECQAAAAHLGVTDLTIHELPVRFFPDHRQEILEMIYAARKNGNYDLVMTSWTGDLHQDHRVVAEETLRAFMKTQTAVLHYEIPGNCPGFSPNLYVPITEEQFKKKKEMLWKYESQVKRRGYFKEEAIRAQIAYHGNSVGTPYAEGFILHSSSVTGFGRKRFTTGDS